MRFRGIPKIKLTKKNKRHIIQTTGLAVVIAVSVIFWNLNSDHTISANGENGLKASYFDNINFTGTRVTRVDDSIDFDWDHGSAANGIEPESFSVRWEGKVMPRYSENYNFYTFSDDGVRLWVDGRLIIDNWTDHGRMEDVGGIELKANQKYSIKLEYYDNTLRSIIKLAWSSKSQSREIVPKSQFFVEEALSAAPQSISTVGQSNIPQIQPAQESGVKAEYYNDINLYNTALVQKEKTINFDWGNSGPPQLNPDTFSARFTSKLAVDESDNYTFYTYSDDGVRLWVNNHLVINNWTDHPAQENFGSLFLQRDQNYDIKMEYYERFGQATNKLSWSSSKIPKQIIPQNVLSIQSGSLDNSKIVPATVPVAAPALSIPTQNSGNPLASLKLFVNPNSDAKNWANSNRSTDPYNATLMDKVALGAESKWLGNWNSDIYGDVSNTAKNISESGAVPVFVVYNIPQRDCGGYSSGGTTSTQAYKDWTNSIASAIGNKKAVIVLEPDALALTDCLSQQDKNARFNLIKEAVAAYKAKGIMVYIDAGHPGWVQVQEMASRLKNAGIDQADGFALNTSNFIRTEDNLAYGDAISKLVGNKHYVVDTSRNGQGSTASGEWCNPMSRGLGRLPTTNTGYALVDAFLWIKKPGESDGNCNGGPSAGQWWPEYALGLASRASW